jgi:phosphoserine phosphatase
VSDATAHSRFVAVFDFDKTLFDLKLARRLGVLDKNGDFGYSGSAWDIPLLAHCRHRFLVNPDKKTIKRTKAALGGRVAILNWTETKTKP